jgi:chorismate synthase
MSSVWGRKLKVTLFGESHGTAIGAVIDGLPAGLPYNCDLMEAAMARRAPGGKLATPRHEADSVRILSGVYQDRLNGAPVCGVIENTDVQPHDDDLLKRYARPAHADFPAHVKHEGFNDPRGGGHFSGRLTAPLVFAGELCRGYLAGKGILACAHVLQIGAVKDRPFLPADLNPDTIRRLSYVRFPLLLEDARTGMQAALADAISAGDSLGGSIECAVIGLPVGLGEPFFDGMESAIAQVLFSIPAVKGVAFGDGFAFAAMAGSEANDGFAENGTGFTLRSNHAGGINGGLTNGMPVIVSAAFRPTPSISRPQQMADLNNNTVTEQGIPGRHDPCVVPRAVPAVEAAVLIAVADMMLLHDSR